MFELFGPFSRPTPSLVPALIVAWPILAAIVILVGPKQRARAALLGATSLGAVGSAAALPFLLSRPAEARVLLSSLGVAARVGQLELPLALALEPGSALLATSAFVVVAATGLRWSRSAGQAFGTRRRAATLSLTLAATLFAILGDGAGALVLGGALASIGATALGRASAPSLVTDRVADIALIGAAAMAFWLLGGSWIDGQYVPDLQPRLVVASSSGAAHTTADLFDEDDDDERPTPRGPQAPGTLSLGGMPGAALMVDGTWLREGSTLLRSPLAAASVPAGPHTLRVHVGPGSDDYYVPRVQIGGGEHLTLVVQGSTLTFREITDQLAARDAAGTLVAHDALGRRSIVPGVAAAGVLLVLAVVAFAARLRLLPFQSTAGDRALPLGGLVALCMAWRYGVFGALAPLTTTVVVALLLVAGSARGLGALVGSRRAWLGAELAFAAVGMFAGAPAAALVHGAVAAVFATRPASSRSSHLGLFFTRASILGACGALAHASGLVVALGLATTLLVSSVPAAGSSKWWSWAIAAAAALVAIDPRTLGRLHPSLVDQALGKSVLPPSLALVVLLAAVTAFGVAASRRTAARLRHLPVWSAPTRVVGAVVLAASSAVAELDARLDGSVQIGEALVRGAGWAFGRLDEAIVSRSSTPLPVPSDRIARALVAMLTLLTLAAFSLPWLA